MCVSGSSATWGLRGGGRRWLLQGRLIIVARVAVCVCVCVCGGPRLWRMDPSLCKDEDSWGWCQPHSGGGAFALLLLLVERLHRRDATHTSWRNNVQGINISGEGKR
jgi:hypothetical protein